MKFLAVFVAVLAVGSTNANILTAITDGIGGIAERAVTTLTDTLGGAVNGIAESATKVLANPSAAGVREVVGDVQNLLTTAVDSLGNANSPENTAKGVNVKDILRTILKALKSAITVIAKILEGGLAGILTPVFVLLKNILGKVFNATGSTMKDGIDVQQLIKMVSGVAGGLPSAVSGVLGPILGTVGKVAGNLLPSRHA